MTFHRFKQPGFYMLCGAAIVVAGFLYDAKFAGLPFQDPTPEMQAEWLFHKAVAEKIMLTGLIVFCVALLWKAAVWVAGKLR